MNRIEWQCPVCQNRYGIKPNAKPPSKCWDCRRPSLTRRLMAITVAGASLLVTLALWFTVVGEMPLYAMIGLGVLSVVVYQGAIGRWS